jgi:RHS repeat-associated protein
LTGSGQAASVTNYYLQDGQNSTRALTNAAGSITDTYTYSAFGELQNHTGATVNSYQYTGQQFDDSTGLYDLRARYYDPSVGRFLSQDNFPINFNHPMELNRYVYAANNPVNLSDPNGYTATAEYGITLSGIAQAAAAGAALGMAVGAVYGYICALLCGGDMLASVGQGMLSGATFGALFGAGFAIAPGLALKAGFSPSVVKVPGNPMAIAPPHTTPVLERGSRCFNRASSCIGRLYNARGHKLRLPAQ